MSTPQKFTKKPVQIEAMQFVGPSAHVHAITCWMERNLYPGLIGNALEPDTLRYRDQAPGDDSRPDKGWYIDPADGALMIRTLEGDMRVAYGAWVIRGVQGEFYPCAEDIFATTYEAVSDDA